jgi:hypothetical protein
MDGADYPRGGLWIAKNVQGLWMHYTTVRVLLCAVRQATACLVMEAWLPTHGGVALQDVPIDDTSQSAA